jgi:acetyl-CoA carboxylase/biotin carboxylase 1
MPVYLQVATEFADLHDKTGRMKAKGVIRDSVPWESSREYFYNRAKRRMLEDNVLKQLRDASKGSLSHESAKQILASMCGDLWMGDVEMIKFYSDSKSLIRDKIKAVRDDALHAQLQAIKAEMESS